ncbi:hypothetical protein GCM10009819_25680 [Agromyces tropicus]|uniref:DUF3592 domain-containing protein n=2 Tax=Agromyces tropicus TaxID=555371 RepID=A0ABN2ULH2_9MICO
MADLPRRRTEDRAGYPPRRVTAGVLAFGAVALGVAGVAAIGETVSDAVRSTSPVLTTVVGERTEEALVADRRGSRLVPYRVVDVELPDGSTAELRSDDLEVGSEATVYRSDSGAVFETPPEAPGPLEWAVGASALAGSAALAVGAVRAVRPRRPG